MAVLGLAVLVVGGTAVQAARARADLEDARTATEQGRAAIVRSDLEAALPAFDRARASFQRAATHLDNPAVAVGRRVPFVGRSISTTRLLAQAGELVAEAGVELAGGALALPEGLASLAPVDGVIPARAIGATAPVLQRAATLVRQAVSLADESPEAGLIGPVADARQEFMGQVEQIDDLLQVAAQLSEVLPSFLGLDEPRRYFLGAQALAEGRALGGCICAFTILSVDRGRLDVGDFVTVTTLGGTPLDIPAPTEDFARRYAFGGSAGLVATANYSPDFPAVAEVLLGIYESSRGERLDGVILADLFVLESLARVSGPLTVDGIGLITADEVVDTLSNDAYDALPDSSARKALLGEVAAGALDGFLRRGGADSPTRAARTLVEVGGGGHLLLYSEDPEEQRVFARTGLSGPLLTGDNPAAAEPDVTLGVFANNTASNKTDYYVDRVVEVDAVVAEGRGVRLDVTVTHQNRAPTAGLPIDVIGPNVPELRAGDSRLQTMVLCDHGCQLLGAGRDGEGIQVDRDAEAGHQVFTVSQVLAAGQQETLQFNLWVPRAGADSEFTLRYANQPRVNPTRLRVDVTPPPGTVVTDSGPFTRADGFWTWQQLPGPTQDLTLTYGPPEDLWSSLADLLNRPLW